MTRRANAYAQIHALGAARACAALLLLLAATLSAPRIEAQVASFARLGKDVLDVMPPSERVSGPPGAMAVVNAQCSNEPSADLRRRIVEIAAQEWGFFGFPVVDQTEPPPPQPPGQRPRRPPTWLDPAESNRVASTIAGYWTATPDGAWILTRQNGIWRGPMGVGARWRDAWSAAFISWVMCSAGVADADRFERAIAHYTYIDQAIEASTVRGSHTAFVAYDVGVVPIEPGDLLCSSRRNGYRTIADRKRHLGTAARSHCDIVVYVDRPRARIMTIGGNVRGAVSLKLQYAQSAASDDRLHRAVGHAGRAIFAHLRLEAAPIDDAAFLDTPTIRALSDDAVLRNTVEGKLGFELELGDARPSS